jgi:hypothetical protein
MKKLIFFIFIAFITVGCSPVTKKEQPARPDWIQLDDATTIGQTFLARYDGFQGIALFLKSDQNPQSKLRLNLFKGLDDSEIIRDTQLDLAEIEGQGYYSFSFPPLNDTTQQDYFFTLELDGPGSVWIGAAPGNTYLNGSLYIAEQPQNSQISFHLQYSQKHYWLGIASEMVSWIGVLAVVLILTAIPGWGTLSWLFPPWRNLNWVGKISLSIGIGLVFYPLLFLWADAFGIGLGAWVAWLFPVLGLVSILYRIIRDWQENQNIQFKDDLPKDNSKIKNLKSLQVNWKSLATNSIPDLAFVIVVGVIVFTRFWPIRSLDAPMWGDSYHHTLISQMILDNGGLFRSWLPYTPLSSFSYHFGFHTIVAGYHWLTGEDLIQTTLWVGQALNVFAIIALYPLAVMVGKNKWAGVLAIVIAGLLSPMPMSYVNWGRYTQLAGQIILPALILLIWWNLEAKNKDWKWISLIWISISGLILTHYRVAIFIPLFYLSFSILRFREYGFFNIIKRAILHVAGALVIFLPWVFRLFDGKLPFIYAQQITIAANQVSQSIQEYNVIGDISGFLPIFIWVLMILSIAWGVWRRNQRSNIISLWWLLILLAANPQWLRLPGEGILSNFAVFIAAYIPAGILIGSLAGDLLAEFGIIQNREFLEYNGSETPEKEPNSLRKKLIWNTILLAVIFGISLWSIRPNLKIVQPAEHALVTRPDMKAGTWIKETLPGDAKFLVNSFFAYGDTLVVGSDAGWWLPLIAQRETTLPPINYGSEQGPPPDFVSFTNDLVAEIRAKGVDHPQVLDELLNRGVTHIYIGQQQGQVNAIEPPLLNAKELMADPRFELVYNQDRVFIFELMSMEG